MVRRELEVAREAVALLQPRGAARLVYVTAEFEPFSSSTRPDVLFVPEPHNGRSDIFVIELRMAGEGEDCSSWTDNFADRKTFVEEDQEDVNVHYGLATSLTADNQFKSRMEEVGVHFFDAIRDAKSLAGVVLDWAESFASAK